MTACSKNSKAGAEKRRLQWEVGWWHRVRSVRVRVGFVPGIQACSEHVVPSGEQERDCRTEELEMLRGSVATAWQEMKD